MIQNEVKRLLVENIPTSLTIDEQTFPIKKTYGKVPLTDITLPTVNLNVMREGVQYYRSIDDGGVQKDSVITEHNIKSALLRYKVGAVDKTVTATQSIVFNEIVNTYELKYIPVLQIIGIDSYVSGTDYVLNTDRTSITWIGNRPANNSTFTVRYSWIKSGYWLASEIVDLLLKNILGNTRHKLAVYDIDVLQVDDIVDISEIYSNDILSVFAFDVQITYPYEWSSTFDSSSSSEDSFVTIDRVILTDL